MKRIIYILLPLLCFYSCDSMTISQIEGTYSYKTSGIVTIGSGNSTSDASIDNVVGTLDVKRLSKGDSILLMFNELNGDVVTVRAEVKGDSVLMPPYQKVYTISTSSSSSVSWIPSTTTTSKYLVTLVGHGIVMDNALIFYQRILSGKLLESGASQSIKSNSIKTVAKKN